MEQNTENEKVFDLTISNNERFKLLNQMNKDDQYEALKRMLHIYTISKVKKIEKFFIHICIYDKEEIDLYIKQELFKSLALYITNKNKENIRLAYENILYFILLNAFKNEPYWLMLNSFIKTCPFERNNYTLFKNMTIFGFKSFKSDIIFKKLFNFFSHFKEDANFEKICTFIIQKYSDKVTIKNKLLLLQIIFKDENIFINDLMEIVDDKSCSLAIKLEACDIMCLNGNKSIKSKAQALIKSILPDTAYINNDENVHLSSIASSVDKTLELLLQRNKGKKAPSNLYEILIGKYSNKVCKASLNRIFNYNFLKFSKYNLTLKEIIENIYICIEECNHNLQKELYNRLDQELIDMYDTCSNGYVTRLINVFSGFEINGKLNLGISISYEDEMYAIFSNKVNKIIEVAPPSLKDILVEELMVPTNFYEKRMTLTRYLRPFIPKIWNEIFEIFKDDLSVEDLDLYCRNISVKYDGL